MLVDQALWFPVSIQNRECTDSVINVWMAGDFSRCDSRTGVSPQWGPGVDLESRSFRSVQGLELSHHHSSAGCSRVPHRWSSFCHSQLHSHLVWANLPDWILSRYYSNRDLKLNKLNHSTHFSLFQVPYTVCAGGLDKHRVVADVMEQRFRHLHLTLLPKCSQVLRRN